MGSFGDGRTDTDRQAYSRVRIIWSSKKLINTGKGGTIFNPECVRLWISWIFPDLGDIPPICEKTHCWAISIIISRRRRLVIPPNASYICKPPRRINTASQISFRHLHWENFDKLKEKLGVKKLIFHRISATNCLNEKICVRFLDFSWYLF